MDWSVVPILTVLVMGLVGCGLMTAAFVMVIRQGNWKQAMQSEPLGRWSFCRRLMFAGALIGALVGLAIVILFQIPGGIPWIRPPTGSEFYYVEAQPIQLIAGEKRDIEITIRYLRKDQVSTTLKYKAQVAAPPDLTITPTSWDVEKSLTTSDAGFNFTGRFSVKVSGDAAPGKRDVSVTITPAERTPSTSTLTFQVVKKGG